MNTSSRFSRCIAACFIAPLFLACLLLGIALAFVGFGELSGSYVSALTGIGAGILSLLLAAVCFRKMRHVLTGKLAPWGRATKMMIAADVVLVLLTLTISPQIQRQRRFSAHGAARRQLRTIQESLVDYRQKNGKFPTNLSYLGTPVPLLDLFDTPHKPSPDVRYTTLADVKDSGKWLYDNRPQDPGFGTLKIDCSHSDDTGHPWGSY